MIFLLKTYFTGSCQRQGLFRALLLLAVTMLCIGGCVTGRHLSELYPPIMNQSELTRPYVKIAVIELSSTRFANPEALTSLDYDWAYNELRESAHRIGADAVVLPEVRIERDTFLIFPSSQIRVKGVAIRFQ